MATTKKSTAAKASKKDETAAQAAKTAKAEEPVKAETKETATKTAAKKAETPEKKAPAKKAPAKKAAPKKVAPKKPATVAEKTPVETKVNFFVEFGGVQVSIEDVIKNVKLTHGKDAKEISVYLKPQESKAYFVADGEEKEMDVFFC